MANKVTHWKGNVNSQLCIVAFNEDDVYRNTSDCCKSGYPTGITKAPPPRKQHHKHRRESTDLVSTISYAQIIEDHSEVTGDFKKTFLRMFGVGPLISAISGICRMEMVQNRTPVLNTLCGKT